MRSAFGLARVLAGALAAFVVPLDVLAQTPTVPPLTSNRPGIAESEELVFPGVVQVEAGGMFEGAPRGDDRRWTETWGQLTLRYGVTRRLEIFGGWDGLSLDRMSVLGVSRIVAGGNDLRVGAKLGLLMEEAHGLTLTFSPTWSFPIGSEEFTSGSQDPSFRVMWSRSLPREWSVWGNLLGMRTSDSLGRYWDTGVMVGVTRDLTDRLGAFVEESSVFDAGRPDNWSIDGGLAWVVGLDLQLDGSVGHTWLDRGGDWFVSAGITLRHR